MLRERVVASVVQMPPSMVMSVSGCVSAGTGRSEKPTDVRVADHAGVAAGLEANLGLRIGGELLAGLQHERPVEVVRLLPCRNVQRALRIQRGLHRLRPDFGGDAARLHLAGGIRPFLGPRFRADEMAESLNGCRQRAARPAARAAGRRGG